MGKGLLPCRCSLCLRIPDPWVTPAPQGWGCLPGLGALALRRRLCKPSRRHNREQPAHKTAFSLPRKSLPLPSNLLCWKKGFPRRNNLLTLGGAFCGQALVLFFEKVALFPHSLKNKAMQRNTNSIAMTWAVTCRSDQIYEISSYSKNLLWFPSELCDSRPVF